MASAVAQAAGSASSVSSAASAASACSISRSSSRIRRRAFFDMPAPLLAPPPPPAPSASAAAVAAASRSPAQFAPAGAGAGTPGSGRPFALPGLRGLRGRLGLRRPSRRPSAPAPAPASRPRPSPPCPPSKPARRAASPRARARTPASHPRRSAACRPSPRPSACRRPPAARGRARRAAARPRRTAARPRAPRGSRCRGGSSARRGSGRWRPRRRGSPATGAGLAPAQPVQRLLALLAAEEKAPEQRARLLRRQPGVDRGRLGHRCGRGPPTPVPSSSACWERWPIFTLWPVESLPAASGRTPASVSMSVVLPAPLGPTSETCSPRSSQISASSQQHARRVGADLDAPAGHLEDDAPAALGRLELELQPLPVARVAFDALDLVQPLDARLRLLGLRRLRAEALDELLQALDLGLLLVDRAAERDLTRGELLAPRVHVPGKKRERPASSSSTAVPTASRNQRSWATSTIAASSDCSVFSSHSSDSMSRWFVGSSSSSRSGSPASARASDARVSSPPENVFSERSRLSSSRSRGRAPSPSRGRARSSRRRAPAAPPRASTRRTPPRRRRPSPGPGARGPARRR